ncbi:MAG: hypothetical protein IMW96_12110 [Thermoanaerobacteraceae bacterium]|uniref:hypothetical protein n=1 Tax=Thermanaeromonas sp. C210 TaxID=2731925 RepID=UPI00155C0C55|nr:hypothetical protein [Thermoanaerobacteraceae bacterium]GFN23596.1 hypothetical protein TAMC210_19130 [Thermanaeromonas sp. C210]
MSEADLNAIFDKIRESSPERDPALEGLESILNELQRNDDKKIGIEFECGDCCKKVINGSKLFFIKNFAVLLPARGDCLFLKVFSGGKIVDKQLLRAIIIPASRICAVEINPVQIDS